MIFILIKRAMVQERTTLEDAKKKEPTIKKEDVEQFFRKNVEDQSKAQRDEFLCNTKK